MNAGEKFRLKASRRVFQVVSVDYFNGKATIHFVDDRADAQHTFSKDELIELCEKVEAK